MGDKDPNVVAFHVREDGQVYLLLLTRYFPSERFCKETLLTCPSNLHICLH